MMRVCLGARLVYLVYLGVNWMIVGCLVVWFDCGMREGVLKIHVVVRLWVDVSCES